MARRRTFGATWWGHAWVEALEAGAVVNPNRLARGRTYARQGRVGALHFDPGRIAAAVKGSRSSAYRVSVTIPTFSEDEWGRVLDAVAARAGHAAALLDGELDPGVVEDASRAGVQLLPQSRELETRCSCPDWAVPCKHSAAVCYLVADDLDTDPFTLLFLRGRTRDEVLTELRQRRRSEAAASTAPPDRGRGLMPARDAWRRPLGTLPPVPGLPSAPGRPAPAPPTPSDAGFGADDVAYLAADAAQRAWAMAAGLGDSALDLDAGADLARRAAAAEGTTWSRVAHNSGLPELDLARRANAWRHGGADALALLDASPWSPPAALLVPGREALLAYGIPAGSIRVRHNTVTGAGRIQLRLGHDRRWWLLEKVSGRWELAGPPADDPDDVLYRDDD